MSFCEECGAALEEGSRFCEECGTALAPQEAAPTPPEPEPVGPERFCEECGAGMLLSEQFCQECGTAVGAGAPAAPVEGDVEAVDSEEVAAVARSGGGGKAVLVILVALLLLLGGGWAALRFKLVELPPQFAKYLPDWAASVISSPVEGPTVKLDKMFSKPGEFATVPVWLVDAESLGTLELTVSYDPAVLEIAGEPMVGSVVMGAKVHSQAGKGGVVDVTVSSNEGISGVGSIVKISFKVIGPANSTTQLKIAINKAESATGETVLLNVVNGEIVIGSL